MSTIVDLTLPTAQFALPATFQAVPEATLETVRVAAHGPRGMMAFLWAAAEDLDELDAALHRDETTSDVTRLSTGSGRALYRISWGPDVRSAIARLTRARQALLGARGTADRWEFRVLFPDERSISSAYENWRRAGIDASIQRINGVSRLETDRGVDISTCQYETLLKAFETGYYEVPRQINLDGLASELGISHQALSERLRRGHQNLVKTTLCDSPTAIYHHPYPE